MGLLLSTSSLGADRSRMTPSLYFCTKLTRGAGCCTSDAFPFASTTGSLERDLSLTPLLSATSGPRLLKNGEPRAGAPGAEISNSAPSSENSTPWNRYESRFLRLNMSSTLALGVDCAKTVGKAAPEESGFEKDLEVEPARGENDTGRIEFLGRLYEAAGRVGGGRDEVEVETLLANVVIPSLDPLARNEGSLMILG